ncbi:MAG TPA: FAD-dependent oxidoreductase [Saprospiraceae bacterium]|nr:FAD-dependent oxidoreductase [Saprospiraceae bacterium]HMU02925.1 FAD-dependent oxidoreductase [Saprospiraceae bacterium]
MNFSFWEKYFIESPTDITIIGSGIVGLSTAISVKSSRPDLSVKILERGSLPYGASTKNAGFACFGSVSELLDDIGNMGEQACMEVVKMRWDGLHKLKSRVSESVMKYQNVGGTELFRHQDAELKGKCLDQISYCNELISDHLSISQCYASQKNILLESFDSTAIFNQYEGTINPVMMMNELIRQAVSLGVSIINGIKVGKINMEDHTLTANENLLINYNKLIICTNGFAAQLLPELPVVPARNQVLITSPITDLNLPSAYHVDKGYIYFRQYEGRILLGGGRNIDANVEGTSEFGNTENIKRYLLNILETIHPGASEKVEHWWSGILGVGDSKFPICKWAHDDLLVGVRLGGMGVAIGTFLGEKLADEVVKSIS